jgi:DNA-binding transcriptional MerR regulator
MGASSRKGPRPHGKLLAGEVGALAGVSGTTIGQWARRGYIRSSQSSGEPRVYSVEDVAEAAIVAELLQRGVRHAEVHAAIDHLRGRGRWPLSEVRLETTVEPRPRIVLDVDGQRLALGPRGWQVVVNGPGTREVRLELRREGG